MQIGSSAPSLWSTSHGKANVRILQVNSVFGRGSTGRVVESVASHLKSEGDDSFVAYGRGDTINEPGFLRIGGSLDVATHGLKSRFLDMHGLGSTRATKEFVSRVQSLAVDVIHLHNVHGYYVNYEVLFDYAKSARIPIVWTMHDCWPFTGHCAFFTYVQCDRWANHCHSCPQKKSYPRSIGIDNSIQNFDRKRAAFSGHSQLIVVTPSRWLANLAASSVLQGYETRVIRNDPDFGVFHPTPSDWRRRTGTDGKYVILGVANVWEDRKGLRYLQDLARTLREDEVLVVVGALQRGTTLPDQVIHVAATHDARELAAIYATSDVFLNPTLEDNYPSTNLEALACGTPVVTFDTGGSAEALERGFGRVTTENTTRGLRQAIDELREVTPPLNDAPGYTGLLRRQETTMAEQYRNLYQEVLA